MKSAMKSALHNQHISSRRFTKLYIIALSSIAIFSILGQILVQISLLQASDDARVINIAGRQRMLSMKLTTAVSALVIPSDPMGREKRVLQIQQTLNSFEIEHRGLINGDATLALPGHNSPIVTQDFASMQPDFDAITAAATDILNILNSNHDAPDSALQPDVSTTLQHEERFIPTMNTTVGHYQSEAEDRVANLKIEEVFLFVLTLVVLALEARFIFHPAIQKLRMSITHLLVAEKNVAARTVELENKNIELELAFQDALAAHRKVMPHARVVAYGHYQVQASNGSYYSVTTRSDVNGNQRLECECMVYSRNMICSHSLAAATLHSALLRNQQQQNRQASQRHNTSFAGVTSLSGTSLPGSSFAGTFPFSGIPFPGVSEFNSEING